MSNASSKGSSVVSDDAVNIYPGNSNMRFCTFWSAITNTKTRMTTITAIAVTFAAVLARTADADSAQDAAKKGEYEERLRQEGSSANAQG